MRTFGEIPLRDYAKAIGKPIPNRFAWFVLGYLVGSLLTFAAISFL